MPLHRKPPAAGRTGGCKGQVTEGGRSGPGPAEPCWRPPGPAACPVGAGPSLGVCSRADNARAFPATLRHYARELNTSLTATRLGGCRARPARQQAYSPTQWGEGSGPREFLSPQPSPPGANNPGLQPPDRPEWLHEAAHSLRGVGTAR